jgi:hypothetical protein
MARPVKFNGTFLFFNYFLCAHILQDKYFPLFLERQGGHNEFKSQYRGSQAALI